MFVGVRRSLAVGIGGLGRSSGGQLLGALVGVCLLVAAGLLAIAPAAANAAQFGGEGTGAGQFQGPSGVALDRSTGDVYVPDRFNLRVDKFDGAGDFQFAWGWGVNLANPFEEAQTCTTATGCREGNAGSGAGQFAGEGPQAIAVDDNESLGDLSAGDVYVVDWEGFRVEKFNAEGQFLLMFGGGVNETSGADVCLAGERCGRGQQGAGDGQFEWAYGANGIVAVGPGGAVYVGDKGRVEVFEASGEWRENISLAGLSAEAKVNSLAVNAAGDVFVNVRGVPGVHEFEPDGTEALVLDEGSEAVEALALDQTGDLFVADSTGGFHILKYDPVGRLIDSFGFGAATTTRGIAYADALGELYVSEPASEHDDVVVLPAPTSAGPWVVPGSASVTPGLRGAVAFAAGVDPEGSEASYDFEYVGETQFKANGFSGAASTPATAVGSGGKDFEDHSVEAALPAKTLVPGESYEWRVVVRDTEGHVAVGAAGSFEESRASLIEGPWAADVASTSATLAARVDPLSSSTDYRLEWGAATSYGHVFAGNVGDGMDYVPISFHIQELEPGVTYHYRLMVTSEAGTIEVADRSFTTQGTREQIALLDGRAWELVTPVDKKGALVQPISSYHVIEAATSGGAIAYEASDAIGEDPVGKTASNEVLSIRGATGWRSEDISLPRNLPAEGASAGEGEYSNGYVMFSADLSTGLVEQGSPSGARPLSTMATERTPYLRSDATCGAEPSACYTPLVSPADVEPASLHFGGTNENEELWVEGASPDLRHIVLHSNVPLLAGGGELYEWSEGRLQSVGDGNLGYHISGGEESVVAHSVSNDGRRVVVSRGADGEALSSEVADVVEKRQVKIGTRNAVFQTMSSDGSRVFFIEGGELYELNVDSGAQADLTSDHGAGEADAGVRQDILGASEAGCDVGAAGECNVYFVAEGVLAGANTEGHAPTAGGDNLYLLHDGAGGWNTVFVATLSPEDEHSWYAHEKIEEEEHPCGCRGIEASKVTSSVSANGRYVSFMSSRSLTGYDNADAASGQPDEEVYLYDALTRRLVCASCNPTGARPNGVLDGNRRLLADPEDAWGAIDEEGSLAGAHWLAAITPSWWSVFGGGNRIAYQYQPRFLSDGGRLFFDSPDALVPQATNGLMDAYEYEPVGIGTCTAASTTFSGRAGGCVDLISAGTSGEESAFWDASESGDDAFFITSSRLVGADRDASYDVYDAHVCAPAAPCAVTPVTPPPCSSGDSCKAAPSPQPAIFGSPASATFSGAGNLAQPAASAVVKKATTRKHRHKRKRRAGHRRKAKGRRAGSARRSATGGKGGRR